LAGAGPISCALNLVYVYTGMENLAAKVLNHYPKG
jgi:hypothetical protein